MSEPNDKSDKRKQSLYFSGEYLREMEVEARRLDRSLSWIVARAWEAGRAVVQRMPDQRADA